MDASSLSGILSIVLVILAAFRLINNLMRAGYQGAGRISILALAKKARESNNGLLAYLNDPHHFRLSAQLLDLICLLLLLSGAFHVFTPLAMTHLFWLFGYLLVFDLILPNTLSSFIPETLVTRLFPFLKIPYKVIFPLVFILDHLGRKHREEDDEEEDDPEDITAFIQAGAEEGIVEEKEKPLLHNILNFSDTVVREVMTPRTDMKCIEVSTPVSEALEVFKKTKYSRLPVFRQDIDNIIGIMRFKDVMELLETGRDVESSITELIFVPELKDISDLLPEMLKRRLQMAIVIDEYGGTSGLITLEDLIEEIVGEIHDEHERPEADEIIRQADGSYLIDGKVLLESFAELFSLDIEEEDIDTIGGFIFNKEGTIPNPGYITRIGDVDVEIVKADKRRIYQVRARQLNNVESEGS